MYVENDFLIALAKPDDWLQEQALEVLETHDDVHTSLAGYAELLVLTYDPEAEAYEIGVGRAVADLVQLVPVRPEAHEQVVLTPPFWRPNTASRRSTPSTRGSPSRAGSGSARRTAPTTPSTSTACR